MSGKGMIEDARQLRNQELQLLAQVEQLRGAAATDSYEVWEVRHQWRRFHELSTALMESRERWRESFREIEQLDLTMLLPNLNAVCCELDKRFEHLQRRLANEAPMRGAKSVALAVDAAKMRALSRFQEAAVVVTMAQLEKLEELSRSLLDCIADIKGYGRPIAAPRKETASGDGLAIDPDRVGAAISVAMTLWIAFLIWVYFDPPGHALFPTMAAIFALVIAMVPQAGASLLFLSWGGGAAFAGIMYVFVMPHLSGFTELAVMIFGAFFIMQYLWWELRQAAARMFAMASFLLLIGIENEQTYSFASYSNKFAWLMLALAVAVAVTYIPRSPRPEKAFLRLLRRFFRHAEFLIAAHAFGRKHGLGLSARWRTILYRNDLLDVPAKLAACSRRIDYRLLPGTAPEQVQELVTSLYALAYRIKDLVDARANPQAELVEQRLLSDLMDWHQVIEERFRGRADPTEAMEPINDRLATRLARMEARIGETFARADEGVLTMEDYKNFYRLLGSYRGLSEAAIDYARRAEAIDWAVWKENRF